MHRLRRFARDRRGAVTVDWVVLTAAVVAFATGVGTVLNNEVATAISTLLQDVIAQAVDAIGREGDD